MFYVDSGAGDRSGPGAGAAESPRCTPPPMPPPTCRSPRSRDDVATPSRTRSCSCARTVATTRAARRSGGHSPVTLRQSAHSDDVWECSHIGGDRFAANLVILPEGLYFGRCDGDAAQRVIADYQRGAIHLDHYRGRSVLGFYEQAAEFFVRRELGLTSIDAASPRCGASARSPDGSPSTSRRTAGTGLVDVHVARNQTRRRTPLTCTGPARPARCRSTSWSRSTLRA